MNLETRDITTETEYEYWMNGAVKKTRKTIMSNFKPYVKTIEYNKNGSMKSIDITYPDGKPYNKKMFMYKESNPYTVHAVVFEAYDKGYCIQRRTAILESDNEGIIREKNEFFSVKVGGRTKDFVCEDQYKNAYLDKFGEVRDLTTKSLIFK